jgi:hypothetical protein
MAVGAALSGLCQGRGLGRQSALEHVGELGEAGAESVLFAEHVADADLSGLLFNDSGLLEECLFEILRYITAWQRR